MKPEKIGAQESTVSLSRTEIAAIGRRALEDGEIYMAISFIGLHGVMETLEQASDTIQPELPFNETAVDESDEGMAPENDTNVWKIGMKKIRGLRRPKEHRKPGFIYRHDY